VNDVEANALLKKLYQKLQAVKAENESLKLGIQNEPVAIIGVGCRLPGDVNSLAAFSAQLANACTWPASNPQGREFFGPAPAHWQGSLVDDVEYFDTDFFSINAREAAEIDPQQRLLLETAYKAVEDARYPMSQLKGKAVGVFVGMSTDDYQMHTVNADATEAINAFSTLGTARSVAAGRIAYTFDFHGPCLQVDTACSSSLMAVHLACQSLRENESTMALAGGVNLMLAPETYLSRDAMGALSPTGKCHTFSNLADGYARSEGCGFVLLKKLSAALADNDRIYAVIYASSVNHDGRSNGLTAPNGEAQRQLMLASLHKARLQPAQIDYVETHGTGTRLGDPIELHAIGEILARENRHTPLFVGSLKSQLGHLEAAAGIASLIKTTSLLVDKCLQPEPVEGERNSLINWDKYPIQVNDSQRPWDKPAGQNRYAAVNAFGLSGTNVNLIVGDLSSQDDGQQAVRDSVGNAADYFLCVSGKTPRSYLKNLFALRDAVANTDHLQDVMVSSCVHKDHHDYRQIFHYRDREQLLAELDAAQCHSPVHAVADQCALVFSAAQSEHKSLLTQLSEHWSLFGSQLDQLLERHHLPASRLPGMSCELASVLLQATLANTFVALGVAPQQLVCARGGLIAAAFFAGLIDVAQVEILARADLDKPDFPGAKDIGQLPSSDYNFLLCESGQWRNCTSLRSEDFYHNHQHQISLDNLPGARHLWLGARDRDMALPLNESHIVAVTSLVDGRDSGAAWSVAGALVALYRSGVDIQFGLLYRASKNNFRAMAPAYEFDRKPLWTRSAPARQSLVSEVQTYTLAWEPMPGPRLVKINNLLVVFAGALPKSIADACADSAWHFLHIEHLDSASLASVGKKFNGAFEVLDLRFWRKPEADSASSFSYEHCLNTTDMVVKSIQALVNHRARYHVVLPPATYGEHQLELDQAPLRGLLRSASHEYPAHIGSLSLCATEHLPSLFKVIARATSYEFFSIGETGVAVERLLPSRFDDSTGDQASQATGALWITGGLGGLGLALAKTRAAAGTRQILLTGRSTTLSRATLLALADIRALGAEVFVAPLDVADEQAVARFQARLGVDLPRVTSLVHAAGVSEFCALDNLTRAQLDSLCAAKIAGSWNLHRLSLALNLDHFILYSSIASVWGSAQLSHYSAANAFMDALAALRSARGLPATLINWGPWAQVGMAARDASEDVRAWGLQPLEAEALEPVLNSLFDRPQWSGVLCNLVHERFQAALEARHKVPLLAPIFSEQPAIAPGPAVQEPKGASTPLPFCDLQGKSRVSAIAGLVAEAMAKALNQPAKQLSHSAPLHELGIDSLLAVDVTSGLSTVFHSRLPVTLIFDYPSISAIATFISESCYAAEPEDELSFLDEAELLRALNSSSLDLLDELSDAI